MAIRLPKPKKAQSLPPIEPSFDSLQDPYEGIESQSATPVLSFAQVEQEFNQSRFFDWYGRISRIQFLVYSAFNALIALLILEALLILIGGFQGVVKASSDQWPISVLGATGLVVSILGYLQFAVTKRRFNDLNKTGWLALIMIVPVINIVVFIYLFAAKGSEGANYYGLPARPATNLKTVLMLLLPLLVIALISLVMQGIVPSYQPLLNSNEEKVTTKPQLTPMQSVNANPKDIQATPASSVHSDNLRTEEVVITGEQLANGVASPPKPIVQVPASPTMPVAPNPVKPSQNTPDMATDAVSSLPVKREINDPSANAASTDSNAVDSTQRSIEPASNPAANNSTISYEDFVKTSQQQIFIDRR